MEVRSRTVAGQSLLGQGRRLTSHRKLITCPRFHLQILAKALRDIECSGRLSPATTCGVPCVSLQLEVHFSCASIVWHAVPSSDVQMVWDLRLVVHTCLTRMHFRSFG